MLRFFIQRVAKGILTLFIVLVFVFIGARLTGDPFSVMYGEGLTRESLAALNEKYGLDKPVAVQFQIYLKDMLKGDFGKSIVESRPVTGIILKDARETLRLGFWSFLFSVVSGILIGIQMSMRPQSRTTRLLNGLITVGYSVPGFIISIFLIFVFSYHLKLLPSMGMGSWKSYILPVLSLSAHSVAHIARYVRTSYMEILSRDYIRTARAKGLGERAVIFKHALRNILIPLTTVIGMLVIDIFTGALFLETVFSWPGMGRRLVDSVMSKDYPVLQFGVICVSGFVILINLAIDLLYGIIDPRIRKEA